MDLRTKLVFALVGVSLASMLALGTLAYTLAGELLTEKTRRQLDSLAETKSEELEKVIQGWQDRVSLIASRTQLRISLSAYNESGSSEQSERIERILTDALRSSRAVRSLAVYDIGDRLVTSVGAAREPEPADRTPSPRPLSGDTVIGPEISFAANGEPRAGFLAALVLEGERIGALRVELDARELIDVTRNVSGLGETGETMVVLPDVAGATWVLHSVRQRASERPGPVQPAGPDDPASRALRGEQGPFTEGLTDYRGESVWAATRLLPGVRWGVVVKFDAAEELGAIREFRSRLIRLGLSLSAFAILLGTVLGLRFAKPIHDLAGVANRIRLGELDARAPAAREDELGVLARTFNQMAAELERQMTLLHEFRKYFEVSLDMLCIAGTDGYFKRVNPAFERTLGWSTEQLVSQPFIEFVHPDDVEATVQEIEKLARGVPTVSFENRYRCADGAYKTLLWTSYPDPETGLLYAIARDISELKLARARTRAGEEPEHTEQS